MPDEGHARAGDVRRQRKRAEDHEYVVDAELEEPLGLGPGGKTGQELIEPQELGRTLVPEARAVDACGKKQPRQQKPEAASKASGMTQSTSGHREGRTSDEVHRDD